MGVPTETAPGFPPQQTEGVVAAPQQYNETIAPVHTAPAVEQPPPTYDEKTAPPTTTTTGVEAPRSDDPARYACHISPSSLMLT